MNIKGTNVLIFSENETLSDAIEPYLTQWGLSVTNTDDLESAQSYFDKAQPKVVIISVDELAHAETTLSVIRLNATAGTDHEPSDITLVLCDFENTEEAARLKYEKKFSNYILASPFHDPNRLKVIIAEALLESPPNKINTPCSAQDNEQDKMDDFLDQIKNQAGKSEELSKDLAEQLEKYQNEFSKQFDSLEENVSALTCGDGDSDEVFSNLKSQLDGFRDTMLNDSYSNLRSNIMEPTENYMEDMLNIVQSVEQEELDLFSPEESDQKSILIVEDDSKSAKMLEATLSHFGYKTEISTNGSDAIMAATTSHPDLILMDVMMPGIDGFQATREIRNIDALSKVPIFFLTALATKSAVEQAKNLGDCDYIRKPIDRKKLVGKIEKLFNH